MTFIVVKSCALGEPGEAVEMQREEAGAAIDAGEIRPATLAEIRSGCVIRGVVTK